MPDNNNGRSEKMLAKIKTFLDALAKEFRGDQEPGDFFEEVCRLIERHGEETLDQEPHGSGGHGFSLGTHERRMSDGRRRAVVAELLKLPR
jgi:hypothetical protein